ncbi:MAG TPA: hypothetical protein VGB04_10500 [Allosphingosinicella sp.]
MARRSLWIALTAAAALCAAAPPLAAQDDEEEAEEAGLDLNRDPEVQARAAVRSGDFRIARLVYDNVDSVGHISFGQGTPGVACDGLLSEVAARGIPWSDRASRFAEAYNAALLADPGYPDRDVCVPVDTDLKAPDWPEFAKPKGKPLRAATSVNRAARASRPDLARAQVAAGRPLDSWDRWYRRPLHWAARRGDVATIDLLLAAGARTEAREPAPPILLASDSGHGAAVERLLAAGADPLRCGKMDVRTSWGSTNTSSRQSCPLRQAIERGFTAPVAPLVKAALARALYEDRDELIVELYKAVELGRPEIVGAFVAGAGQARDRFLQPSVLRMAAYRLDRSMLRALLALGGGHAARSPAEERLWLAAARLGRPEPLAMLIWFGGDLNYLPAADRGRLEEALPGLTADRLRPFLVKAAEARERAWDSVLAGDLPALDALARDGVDFAERRGETALSRAARADLATLRWVLAHGGRADTYENREERLECSSISDDFGRNKHSRAQRLSFIALCEEQEGREPRPRPGSGFSRHALGSAVTSGDPARIELLLPGSRPEAALDTLPYLAFRPPDYPGRLALLTRLAALAAEGDRSELAWSLGDVLERKDEAATAAILSGFIPKGRDELRGALDIASEQAGRCGIEPFRFLREKGVDLSQWRDLDGGNLYARAATCDSPEFAAFAATVPGIGVNDLDDIGRTPFETLPWDKREGAAGKALAALGAKSCEDLHGEDSDRCGSPGIRPDPAL